MCGHLEAQHLGLVGGKQDWLYKTVCSDCPTCRKYDMLVFFSPSGIESLFKNFPDFEQGETRIAVFGPTTRKAAEAKNLRIDVGAPNPKAPSMSMAIENHIPERTEFRMKERPDLRQGRDRSLKRRVVMDRVFAEGPGQRLPLFARFVLTPPDGPAPSRVAFTVSKAPARRTATESSG